MLIEEFCVKNKKKRGSFMIQDIEPHRFDNEYQWIAAKEDDYVLYYIDNQILVRENEGEIFFPTVQQIKEFYPKLLPEELQFLFQLDEKPYFLLKIQKELQIQAPWMLIKVHTLREKKPKWKIFAGTIGSQLFQWYRTHRFCGVCSGKMIPSLTERALQCETCKEIIYPNIAPAVIITITSNNNLLLTRYAHGNYKKYALVAGYVEIGETLEETVKREVMEEVGLKVKNIRYYKSQPWALTNSLLSGFFAELDGKDQITLQESELAEGAWFSRENIPLNTSALSLTNEMIEVFRAGKEYDF